MPKDAGARETRALVLGNGDAATFTPYVDGGDAEIVQGPQGGFMITPTIRLDATAADGDMLCVIVRFQNVTDGVELVSGAQSLVGLERHGQYAYSPALFDLMTYTKSEIEGRMVTVTASVQGEQVEGEQTVHVVAR